MCALLMAGLVLFCSSGIPCSHMLVFSGARRVWIGIVLSAGCGKYGLCNLEMASDTTDLRIEVWHTEGPHDNI